MTAPERILFSVDLEPNLDGTLDGVRDAMEWYDETVPRGTVFTTHRIATELPDLVAELSERHEVGVHVHPKEFGHNHDELAELAPDRQAELITATRDAVADAVGAELPEVISFRAGRHSASDTTVEILRQLGFTVDASVHVRYDNHLPRSITRRSEPFEWDGLYEVPTTYARLSLFSRCALRGTVTATAATLRTDRRLCSGMRAVEALLGTVDTLSFYMHPFDATRHHDGERMGSAFRDRVERVFSGHEARSSYLTVSECADREPP